MARPHRRLSLGVLLVVAAALAIPALHLGRQPSPSSQPSRPPGLVQAGNSKTTCIDVALDRNPQAMRPLENELGFQFNCLETFSDADVTWAAWVDPWVTRAGYGYLGWLHAAPKQRTIVLTQNLVPDDVIKTQPTWRSLCAQGAYARYSTQLAEHLVATGFGYSVIRLGHEMNGTWYLDDIGDTVGQWEAWAGCFRHIVVAMRAVPGAHFLFDWNVNAGYRNIPLHYYYPGDQYVDIIGIDAYDSSQAVQLPPVGSPDRFQVLAAQPLGIDALEAFATAHHKPLSIPEWGTMVAAGDDGAYVEAMGSFIATHDVAYQSWFDTGSQGTTMLSPTGAPKAFAAYVAAFGPGSPVAQYQARALSS